MSLTLHELKAERERRRTGQSLQEEAEYLAGNFGAFIRAAWHIIEPYVEFKDNWHIDVMAEAGEAIHNGEVRKLAVWVPPGSMKSDTWSVLFPGWEWATMPWLRYFMASYDLSLSTDLNVKGRTLIESDWFQLRWPTPLTRSQDRRFSNASGGERIATSPTSVGSGKHGHRLIIDDPFNAKEILSEARIAEVNEWYDGTLPTRFADPKNSVEILVMQRLGERDLAAHALEFGGWEVLCLPERYEANHPYASPKDPRSEGELLWKGRVDEAEHEARVIRLGAHRTAGQLQQRPAPREGAILKRTGWRFYPRDILEAAEEGDVSGFPRFRKIGLSWDTAFKEKTTSDYVCGGVWGLTGGDRYLLRVFHDRAGLARTKTVMKELRAWAIERWPRAGITTLIEKSANGVEIIEQLQREIPGVKPWTASVDKVLRAEAAEPDFDSGNVFICGALNPTLDDYDPALTPAWAQKVIEECAGFPLGEHDDIVDMVTQLVNWARTKSTRGGSVTSPADATIPATRGIPR